MVLFDGEKVTPETKAQLNEKYGLDKPLSEQYRLYITGLVKKVILVEVNGI